MDRKSDRIRWDMTAEAQRAAIKKLIDEQTQAAGVSKQTARDYLVREGFYTADGKLAEQYGGERKSPAQ